LFRPTPLRIPPASYGESYRPTQKNSIINSAKHQIRHKKIDERSSKKADTEGYPVAYPGEYSKKNKKNECPKYIEDHSRQKEVFTRYTF